MAQAADTGNRQLHEPGAKLSYRFDWTEWLNKLQTTISAAAWSITPNDGSLAMITNSFTSTDGTVVLSGGSEGVAYQIRMHITTAGGLEDFRTLYLDCGRH